MILAYRTMGKAVKSMLLVEHIDVSLGQIIFPTLR